MSSLSRLLGVTEFSWSSAEFEHVCYHASINLYVVNVHIVSRYIWCLVRIYHGHLLLTNWAATSFTAEINRTVIRQSMSMSDGQITSVYVQREYF